MQFTLTESLLESVSEKEQYAALMLLKRIQGDLDPDEFTVREIVDEGLDGYTSIGKPGSIGHMTEHARMKRVRRLLSFLMKIDLVEKSEVMPFGYSLTEDGIHYDED